MLEKSFDGDANVDRRLLAAATEARELHTHISNLVRSIAKAAKQRQAREDAARGQVGVRSSAVLQSRAEVGTLLHSTRQAIANISAGAAGGRGGRAGERGGEHGGEHGGGQSQHGYGQDDEGIAITDEGSGGDVWATANVRIGLMRLLVASKEGKDRLAALVHYLSKTFVCGICPPHHPTHLTPSTYSHLLQEQDSPPPLHGAS